MCDIYPMMRQFALGMLMLTAGANLLAQGAEINWIKVDELEAAQARESRKVMIDVYTKWCGPCKMIAPLLDEAADEYADRMTVAKINIDENPNTPPKFGIRSIPTLMLFKDGAIQAQKVGAFSKSQLTEFLDSNL